MIIQPQISYLPEIDSRSLKRRLLLVRKKTLRYSKAKLRRAKSKSLAAARRQYYISQAYADVKTAARQNEDIFITAIIAGLLLGYGLMVSGMNFLLLFFQTAYDAATVLGISMFVLTLTAFGVFGVLLAWTGALALNMLSISLMDGANRKKHRSTRTTFRQSLAQAGKVADSWIAVVAVSSLPLVIPATIAYAYIRIANLSLQDVMMLLPYGGAIAAVLVLSMLLQYSLVPYVVLFEQRLTLPQAFARSKQLLRRRGRLFLLALYTLASAALYGLHDLAYLIGQWTGFDQWLVFSAGTGATLMLINCILVMLYRKRKLARSR